MTWKYEHPIVEPSIGEIRSPIEHRDYSGLEKFLDRHRFYAAWEARRLLLLEQSELAQNASECGRRFSDRQWFKYRHLGKWWYPLAYFGYTYILKGGVFDAVFGFYYAFYKAWYFLTLRLLIKEFRSQKAEPHAGM